jgi:hypothetical protein
MTLLAAAPTTVVVGLIPACDGASRSSSFVLHDEHTPRGSREHIETESREQRAYSSGIATSSCE